MKGEYLMDVYKNNEYIENEYNPSLIINKVCNEKSATLLDKVKYTFIIFNNGNVSFDTLKFKDDIPKISELIKGTFIVDNEIIEDVDLIKGVDIGALDIGEYKNVLYEMCIKGGTCSRKVKTIAHIEAKYRLRDETIQSSTFDSNESILELFIDNFKTIVFNTKISLYKDNLYIKSINEVQVKAKIIESYVIKTPQIISNEGQNLSGNELVINGKFCINLDYTSDSTGEGVCSHKEEMNFCIPISIPSDYENNYAILPKIEIKEIYYNLISDNCVNVNFHVMVKAII